MNDEFYIGYLPKAPPGVAQRVRKAVVAAFAVTVAVALTLVFSQNPFAASRFEYGEYKSYSGMLIEKPYPRLVAGGESYLLVGPGKHGFAQQAAGLDARTVDLRGALITRDGRKLLEVMPESLRASAEKVFAGGAPQSMGEAMVRGEIVDSKCYFGVMNPGSGKVHRDCAVRCISGGIPPVLQSGKEYYLLSGFHKDLLRLVAQPVTLRGELSRAGEWLILELEP